MGRKAYNYYGFIAVEIRMHSIARHKKDPFNEDVYEAYENGKNKKLI